MRRRDFYRLKMDVLANVSAAWTPTQRLVNRVYASVHSAKQRRELVACILAKRAKLTFYQRGMDYDFCDPGSEADHVW